MIEVLKPGLETSIQDLPGRIGYWEQGFPPSGPFDAWSFRLANLLVGNPPEAAGLECQFIGPTLRFARPAVVAVTGADMAPTVDGNPVPMWQSLRLEAGQVLALGPARCGARAYVAVAGGIDTPPVLGSRSTFHMAGVGGLDGYALKQGQSLPVGLGGTPPAAARRVKADRRPDIRPRSEWTIEVVRGPNDDWIDAAGHERFLAGLWRVQAKSNRTGLRLSGPPWSFAPRATNKRPEHGQHPSNILDHGYPLGAINLAGETPIILAVDGPSTGGFINPYTVPTAAFWKLAQTRPGDVYRFSEVSVEDAQAMRRSQRTVATSDDSLEPA
ncbi:MAG: biotin-dependent carboxyltransferase [Rhodospirillaceae bacterium]|nr:biotin-dependent carboxyltransferase [Rhodospirillaceae bacterium]